MSFFTLKRTALASAALALLSAGAAQANLGSGNLAVAATMAGGCEITNTTVDFGTIAGFFPVGQVIQREHMVRVHCSPGVGGQLSFNGQGTAFPANIQVSGNDVAPSSRMGACPAPAESMITGSLPHVVLTTGLAQDFPVCVRLTSQSSFTGLPSGNFSFTLPIEIR